jgi:mannose-6-phosphate isomerase-like protein (cupin superfamily)
MTDWYFAYANDANPERLRQDHPGILADRPATLAGHRLIFAGPAPNGSGGEAAIEPSPGDEVLGTAYQVDAETLATLAAGAHGKALVEQTIRVDGGPHQAKVLVAPAAGPPAAPTDAYLGRVREGLTYFYPVTVVDAYLRRAMARQPIFADIQVQRAADAVYNDEYNCRFRRLYPWKGMVRTPWGSAVGILPPGGATTPHHHDEEETAVVLAGSGTLTLAGKTTDVARGDVVFLPPDSAHTILNTSPDEDLEVLFIWWGGADAEAARRRLVG